MIQLSITKTYKSYSAKDYWTAYSTSTHNFASIADAFNWIDEHYPKHRRSKMYRDLDDGSSIHCGYVIGFRNHFDPLDKHLERHWIEFREVIIINLDEQRKGK
jgi:hypothetical protein